MLHYCAPPSMTFLVYFSSSICLICLEPAAVLVTLCTPNNVPHQICRPCCGCFISFNTPQCPVCRSPVDLYKALGIPLCSNCNLSPAVANCFNPDCLSGPTPVCEPCSYTLYFLTKPICPPCAGLRPIPYVDTFVMNSIRNFH